MLECVCFHCSVSKRREREGREERGGREVGERWERWERGGREVGERWGRGEGREGKETVREYQEHECIDLFLSHSFYFV